MKKSYYYIYSKDKASTAHSLWSTEEHRQLVKLSNGCMTPIVLKSPYVF